MELTLLRHATAEDVSSSGQDRDRQLTPEGLVEAKTAGFFLKRLQWEPDLVLTSPYRRTVETAAQVEIGLGRDLAIEESDFLASGMTVEHAVPELSRVMAHERVLLIGHQPDFGNLIAFLTGCPAENVRVPKGSLWGLRLERLASAGARIHYFAPPKLIKRVVD